MNKHYFLVIMIFLLLFAETFGNDFKISELVIGEKVRPIDINKKFMLHVYIFIDIGACQICTNNIPEFIKALKNQNVDIKLIINSIKQKDADNFSLENKLSIDVIGDEFGIFKSNYKILFTPSILVLSSEGIVLKYAKLGSRDIKYSDLVSLCKEKENELNLNKTETDIIFSDKLKQSKRTRIQKDGKPILSDIFLRDAVFSPKLNLTFLRNGHSIHFYIVDSNCNVIKCINKKNYPNLKGFKSNTGLEWVYSDSVLFLINDVNIVTNNNFEKWFQNYDIIADSLYPAIKMNIEFTEKRNSSSSFIHYLEGKNKFISFFYQRETPYFLMENIDTTAFIYDKNGNCICGFDKPDAIYKKYKISAWFKELCIEGNHNEIITMQGYSDVIKFWDEDFKLKNEIKINMGKEYRKINQDFKDNASRTEAVSIYNRITRTNTILYDKTKKHILICFYNQSFPDGVIDAFSPEVKMDKFFIIVDRDGNRLTNENLRVPSSCIPFYFNNGKIIATEIDQNKRTEIVNYDLQLK